MGKLCCLTRPPYLVAKALTKAATWIWMAAATGGFLGQGFLRCSCKHHHSLSHRAVELAVARAHFFRPRKFANPFNQSATVDYDTPHDLLVIKTEDALQNTVEAANNYRTLQPRLMTDANGKPK